MTSRYFLLGALGAVACAAPLAGQTVLIDYDDLDAGNGIHDSELLMGGFTGLTDAEFIPWVSLDVGSPQFRENLNSPVGGATNYVTTLDRVLAVDTGHTIELAEAYELEFAWRDAANWDGDDTVAMVLYYTEDDTIGGPAIDLVDLDSGAREVTADWEAERLEAALMTDLGAVGRTLFVRFVSRGAQGEFSRIDDLFLSVAPPPDPFLVASGEFDFGLLFHGTGTDSTSRRVAFTNVGVANSLTIEGVNLGDDGGGVYSVTDAPGNGSVIPPGGTFEVEVTATGGGGQTLLPGQLLVDAAPDDQDMALPVSATIATTGDPFLLVENGDFENGLDGWAGNAVATTGFGSAGGSRVRGVGDDRGTITTVFSNVLAQPFAYPASPDFEAAVSFAIPDFDTFAPFVPADPGFLDRSFHLAILGAPTLPGGGVFDDADAANTLINLFYFPAGVSGDTGAGFFLYDGVAQDFVRLPDLGTLTASTGFNADGTPPGTLNVYRLTITGTGFGTASASYDIAISDANQQNVAATVSGLTTFHGIDPTTATAKSLVLTTGDTSLDTTEGQVPQQPSFWVDDVSVSLSETLPLALFEFERPPSIVKMFEQATGTVRFSVTNVGFGADLTLSNPVLADARFSLVSPALPQSLAPGGVLDFEVTVDASEVTGDAVLSDVLALATNDGLVADQEVALEAQVLAGGRRLLVDYDDGIPGNGIHEGSLRNGGFEEGVAGDDFIDTPEWFARFSPEADGAILTVDAAPVTGSLHGQATGFAGGDRAHPTQLFSLEDWTLGEGDFFTVEVTWKDGVGYTEGDELQILVEIVDADGNLIASPSGDGLASRLLSQGFPLEAAGSYQTTRVTTRAIPAGDPWIGGRPVLRFLKSGSAAGAVDLDNVTLTGFLARPGQGGLRLTASSIDPATGQVTLRWVDSGGPYTVQGTDDLDFATNLLEIPVDGTADTSTYPGEVEFTFSDASGGLMRFWRVSDD